MKDNLHHWYWMTAAGPWYILSRVFYFAGLGSIHCAAFCSMIARWIYPEHKGVFLLIANIEHPED